MLLIMSLILVISRWFNDILITLTTKFHMPFLNDIINNIIKDINDIEQLCYKPDGLLIIYETM